MIERMRNGLLFTSSYVFSNTLGFFIGASRRSVHEVPIIHGILVVLPYLFGPQDKELNLALTMAFGYMLGALSEAYCYQNNPSCRFAMEGFHY